jgi:molybdopterin-guanine dinucleotide biosynthesis protein A
MISAVILSAGESSRMGRPKALLLFGGLNWAGVNTRVISAQRPKQG